ncbi:MAG: outer membrane beta-barrel family protein, partial [Bacteroidota bacterium]
NFFGKDQSSEFNNTPVMNGEDFSQQQQTRTDFKEGEYTFQLDYTHPFNEVFTLESGAQYVYTDVTNDFSVSNWNDNVWVVDPDLTNVFDFDLEVLGVYSAGAYEGDKFGLKLGLRLESTDMRTLLVTTDESSRQQFINLFPTAHTSYKLNDNFSLQAGYSRRIYRPGLWDLNPFTNIRNNFSISAGNPLLQPEFTDSYEVTSIFDKGPVSFSAAIYHRYTTDVIEEVATFEDNVSFSRPENIGINRATGLELNGKYNPTEWWTLNGDFNYNYFSREGSFETTSFDFTADQWTGRLTNKFKLPADIDFEVIGNYRSALETFQMNLSGYFFADLGVRKKIMNGKTILNLSIRDVFASRIFESETI